MKRLHLAAACFVGFVVALLLVPTGALSAVTTSFVTVTSKDGARYAGVTPAGQEQIAEAAPSTFVRAELGDDCTSFVYAVPATKALIITGIDYFMVPANANNATEQGIWVGTSASPCTGTFVDAGLTKGGATTQSHDFQPGIAIPAGSKVGMMGSNDSGTAMIYGYLVPASAVPASALTTHGGILKTP